jgi:Ca-activated chloride channel family protein
MSSRRRLLAAAAAVAVVTAALSAVAGPKPADGAPTHSDPGKLMLVMDASGSMKKKLPQGGKTRIGAAKHALRTVIKHAPRHQPMGLRVFGATVFDKSRPGACSDSQRVVGLGTKNRGKLRRAVAKYQPYGETPMGYALQQAGKDVGTSGKRNIMLVSDGEPNCQPNPCKIAGQLAGTGITLKIDVVGLDVSGKARKILQCVAKKGHGNYYDAHSTDELTKSMTAISTRAARPYRPAGKKIRGTPSDSDIGHDLPRNPTRLRPGNWVDVLGSEHTKRETLSYRYQRTMKDSTVYLSANSIIPIQPTNYGIRTQVSKTRKRSSECMAFGGDDEFLFTRAANSKLIPGHGNYCAHTQDIYWRIQQTHGRHAGPLEIRVVEEPPLAPGQHKKLPARSPKPKYITPKSATHPQHTTGGESFSGATELAPGSYRSDIVRGEWQMYAVHLDWGQYLDGEVTTPRLTTAAQEEFGSTEMGVFVYNPARAVVAKKLAIDGYSSMRKTKFSTYRVAYRNRDENDARVDYRPETSMSGTYYIVVALHDWQQNKRSTIRPYRLNIAVHGKPHGKPKYARHAKFRARSARHHPDSKSAGPSRSAAAGTSGGPHANAGRSHRTVPTTSRTVPYVAGGLALAGVLAAVTVLIVYRRRRH